MKKLFLLALTIIVGLTSSMPNNKQEKENNMAGFFKKADPIEKFWAWFKDNEKRFRKFEENPDKYLNEVLTQAKKIQAGLAIEFEPPKNGVINMTVSADGDKNLFSVVQHIIAKAPGIEGWKFIAFRQRLSLEQVKGMKLKAEDHELDPEKMKFFPMIDGDNLDIIIYTHGVKEENYNQIAYGGLLLLDNILGEFDCVTKVRSYDFHNMPVKKDELDGLLPLLDLAEYVDKFHNLKKH
jgi:diadenosine tetraphosphate (Ap4A) HIT family hydrolase